MKPAAKPKLSEAKLCADFQAWIGEHHPEWTPYPETAGWDLLLVRPADGCQIGIQAKLHFNATLLRQVLPDHVQAIRSSKTPIAGPDYRAILVPKNSSEIAQVCYFCGLVYFHRVKGWVGGRYQEADGFSPSLAADIMDCWTDWMPEKRHELPGYVPDVAAGAAAPTRLTEWKEKALRICALLEVRGHVTREDFRRLRIDYRRWVPSRWLRFDRERGVYVSGDNLYFGKQHPDVFKQIIDEVRRECGDAAETPVKAGDLTATTRRMY